MSADGGQRTPAAQRVDLQTARGVTRVDARGDYAYLVVHLPDGADRTGRELTLYRALADQKISINLVRLHPASVSFVTDVAQGERAVSLMRDAGFEATATAPVSMVSLDADEMRLLCGVMGRIARTLVSENIPMLQTGDGPDSAFVLVPGERAERAVAALQQEFGIRPPGRPIIVQKFGGRCVATVEARRLAAERVRRAHADGYAPVVVVSAIGRRGEPYATDTLLEHLESVAPELPPPTRERDLLMACGEIISTVIMAQTLQAAGLRALALTGGQAGILTDRQFGDAQIIEIDPSYIQQLFERNEIDAVVVAGFQGTTAPAEGAAHGDITTLGRGGSDTTASALGAALRAERVEVYTHVDGVMTADPEVVPEARTLPIVTYEEVCNMAHHGAKVLHPRAAEIARRYQIPLWVKSVFADSPGTRVAPLAEIQPPSQRGVTGVTHLPDLAHVTVEAADEAERPHLQVRFFEALGEQGVPLSLLSLDEGGFSFLVDGGYSGHVERIAAGLNAPCRVLPDCDMISVVALSMWEVPGFLYQIAHALYSDRIPVLQMADSEGSVACLVRRADAAQASRALHARFEPGK